MDNIDIYISLLSAMFVAIGLCFTAYTIISNRKFIEFQQKAKHYEIRPQVIPLPIALAKNRKSYIISFCFKNDGILAAKNIKQSFIHEISKQYNGRHTLNSNILRINLKDAAFEKPRYGDFGFDIEISHAEMNAISKKGYSIKIAYLCIYDDHMGGKYYYKYSKEFYGADLQLSNYLKYFNFNDPSIDKRTL